LENYSKANYVQLINILTETYGFEIDYVHSDTICEFLYANKMPMFRLLYVEDTKMIVISFQAGLSKEDAFDIMGFIHEQMPLVKRASEYIVTDAGETLFGQEAYLELQNQIESKVVKKSSDYEEYIPSMPVSMVTNEAIYEASHPEGLNQAKVLKEHQRWFAKFKWDD